MADNNRKERQPPITPEEALEQFAAAGHVIHRTMVAGLDFMSDLSAARAVRLDREALRVGRRYGAGSPEAAKVAARVERHDSFAAALALEKARADVPVPDRDAERGTLFGRVVEADGRPVDAAIVEAVDANGEVLATADEGPKGAYRLAIEREGAGETRLRVTRRGKKQQPIDFGAIDVQKGSRTFRDLVLAAADEREAPWGAKPDRRPPQPAAADVKVPDVTGMSAEEAVAALQHAGLRVGAVEGKLKRDPVSAQKPRANARVKPGTAVDLIFGAPKPESPKKK